MIHLRRPRGYTKFLTCSPKDITMKTKTEDVVYAGEWREFFYEGSHEQVPEGKPVGIDIETDEGVELVLFSNIYWSPQYEDNENN